MSISELWSEFTTWWTGTSFGYEVDAAAQAALAELEAIEPDALKSVAEVTSTAILTGLAAGNPTSAVISAGILAAEEAFKAQESTVASTTVTTFVSALHNAVTTQQAAGSITPATPAV